MNTAYIAVGVILVVILIGVGAWWYLSGPIADGAIFVDGGNTRWAYVASSNSLVADRTFGDISGIFSDDMKSIKFSPSNVTMAVVIEGGNLKLANGDTLRAA